MKKTILRILLGAIPSSLISVIVVSIIGYVQGWTNSTQFSDGFFWAGGIMFMIGFASLLGHRQHTTVWPPVYVNPADRAKAWALGIIRGQILMAIFGLSGLLLFGLSFLVVRLL